MKVVVRTATEARREFFDLVNAAMYGGQITWITKGKRKATKIVPVDEKKINWVKYKRSIAAAGGIFTGDDVKDVQNVRRPIYMEEKH